MTHSSQKITAFIENIIKPMLIETVKLSGKLGFQLHGKGFILISFLNEEVLDNALKVKKEDELYKIKGFKLIYSKISNKCSSYEKLQSHVTEYDPKKQVIVCITMPVTELQSCIQTIKISYQ